MIFLTGRKADHVEPPPPREVRIFQLVSYNNC